MSGHDAEYIEKFQFDNTAENRETLAKLIISYWDMKDLVNFAESTLEDSWDAELVGEQTANESWTSVVEICKEQLEDLCGTPDQ
jgi:hypothetical protein